MPINYLNYSLRMSNYYLELQSGIITRYAFLELQLHQHVKLRVIQIYSPYNLQNTISGTNMSNYLNYLLPYSSPTIRHTLLINHAPISINYLNYSRFDTFLN